MDKMIGYFYIYFSSIIYTFSNKLGTNYGYKNPRSLIIKYPFLIVTADVLYLSFYLFLFYA